MMMPRRAASVIPETARPAAHTLSVTSAAPDHCIYTLPPYITVSLTLSKELESELAEGIELSRSTVVGTVAPTHAATL